MLNFFTVAAQEADSAANPLTSVTVKAYGQPRRLNDVAAAVGFVGPQTLHRFGSASVVQAVNTVAGVRMEERSPGSYRINIRGSSLRSPFGVRNTKVYLNEIPLTDPGGQTYLNALGYHDYGSLEILKSPGSSLYGAGTGGVMLIESLRVNEPAAVAGSYTGGSFGLCQAYAAVTTGKGENKSRIGIEYQKSDGYRKNAALKRQGINWTGRYRISEKQTLHTTFLYSYLFYQTPGALTLEEFTQNPKQARPGSGGFPGAEDSRASVTQNTFLAGGTLTQTFSKALSQQFTAYGAFNALRNPTLRNFGKSMEPNVGGRTVFTLTPHLPKASLHLRLGGELQQNFSTSAVYENNRGEAGALQTDDEIRTRQVFVFVQGDMAWQHWELTAGASLNSTTLLFRRNFPSPLPEQRRTLNNQLAPRVALSYRFEKMTLYSSVSKGFSPPTAAELLPSGSAINLMLQPEQGINYDVGMRGTPVPHLTLDVNAFYFRLQNTIVQRRDAGGGDYFINAGKTAQKGLETSLQYAFLHTAPLFRQGTLWLSHTYHHFRYREFKQQAADYAGKALPGVAPHTLASGVDMAARNGIWTSITYYFSSRLSLNDANTAYAPAYHLLGVKAGIEKPLGRKMGLMVSLGANNLLNQRYSPGSDSNGFGGRYYNAAAGRNYYVSLTLQAYLPQPKKVLSTPSL